MASARNASLNGGPWQSRERGPGAEPLVGVMVRSPLKLKAFLYILIQNVAKS